MHLRDRPYTWVTLHVLQLLDNSPQRVDAGHNLAQTGEQLVRNTGKTGFELAYPGEQ
ncbi:hypothetical protein PUN4_1050013 [Paraburkholderia unamae]|nr:hypothetical protein PUN4_1050013 [Paraburkholderia unamae]